MTNVALIFLRYNISLCFPLRLSVCPTGCHAAQLFNQFCCREKPNLWDDLKKEKKLLPNIADEVMV